LQLDLILANIQADFLKQYIELRDNNAFPLSNKNPQLHHQHWWCTYWTATATQCQQPIGSCSSCGQWDCAIARWNGSKRIHCRWFWCRERITQPSRCHCHWPYPQGDPPARCSHSNCRLNTCRLFHYHHCHYCVRCRRCRNPIVDWIEVGMQIRFEWPADHVLLQHCVCRCYSRLITTRRLQWYYCHCSWRSRRLSFAMVGEFRVGDAPANKEVNETTYIYTVKRKFSFAHFSTGFQYKFYRTSHVLLS
jgi:hypothetical protein